MQRRGTMVWASSWWRSHNSSSTGKVTAWLKHYANSSLVTVRYCTTSNSSAIFFGCFVITCGAWDLGFFPFPLFPSPLLSSPLLSLPPLLSQSAPWMGQTTVHFHQWDLITVTKDTKLNQKHFTLSYTPGKGAAVAGDVKIIKLQSSGSNISIMNR